MKIKIKKIGRREVQTKDGTKWNMSLQDESGEWFSGWPSDATKDWKEGMTVDVDVSEKTVGDKTYKNFKPKPVAGAPAPAQALASNAEIVSLLKEMVVYLKILAVKDEKKPKAKKEVELPPENEPPPHSDEDVPPAVDENGEDCPPF